MHPRLDSVGKNLAAERGLMEGRAGLPHGDKDTREGARVLNTPGSYKWPAPTCWKTDDTTHTNRRHHTHTREQTHTHTHTGHGKLWVKA